MLVPAMYKELQLYATNYERKRESREEKKTSTVAGAQGAGH